MSQYNSPEGKKSGKDDNEYSDDEDNNNAFSSPTSVTSENSEKRSPYAISFVGMSKMNDEEITPFPTAFEREEANARGGDVTIHFICSDGNKYVQNFAIGQTVQVLKSWLDSEKGIPYASQMIYLGSDSNGKVMIDPLSLNDFSDISVDKDVNIFVDITGSSKK
jgi:hypothetical protein